MLAKVQRLKLEQELLRSRLGKVSRRSIQDSASQTTLPVSIEPPVVIEQPAIIEQPLVIEQPVIIDQPVVIDSFDVVQPIDGQIIIGTPQPLVPTPAEQLPRSIPQSRSIPLLQPNTPALPSGTLRSFEVYE